MQETDRPSWDETFYQIALGMSRRATCPRLACGAVIVSHDHQMLTAGYNGAPRGERHCTEVGCLMEGGHCVRAIHAETNAVLQAARTGVSVAGGVMYLTQRPCVRCAGLLIQSGVTELVYGTDYDSDGLTSVVLARLDDAGIVVRRINEEKAGRR